MEASQKARKRENLLNQALTLKEEKGSRQVPRKGDGQTSFFFTNFRQTYLLRIFGMLFTFMEKSQEVVIPGKMDKKGDHFGFVRFTGVHDVRVMALNLDKILIEKQKLWVNVPKL